jgi:type IV secretion system protein VirB11
MSSSALINDLKVSGIQNILDMEGITDIAVNQPHEIWFDRGSGWERTISETLDFDMCWDIAKRLAVMAGIRNQLGSEVSLVSVTLPDGERGQIAVPPATKNRHVSMSFRKPSLTRFTLKDYQDTGRFSSFAEIDPSKAVLSDVDKELLMLKDQGRIDDFFQKAVTSYKNILIVGGTGSGKSTVMKAMVDHYPTARRIFTIEDVHEVDLPMHPNHVNLFYKEGGLTPRKIIEGCMRMKPDHVLLAELRGDEAWSYLEMLNTGHQGSITTIHANDCLSAKSRLATLIKQSEVGLTLDIDIIMKTINTSIDVIAFFKGTYLTELYFKPEEKLEILNGKG